MPIIDASNFRDHPVLTTDVCIIGSGAAGLAVASEFFGSSISVLILEGGAESVESCSQDLYQSEVVGLPHDGIHNGRFRVFGGSTTRWAGQALPLSPLDFQKRDWVRQSGWPIAKTQLNPYYRRAEDFLGLRHVTYDKRTWPPKHPPPSGFLPGTVEPTFSQFAKTPNLATLFRKRIAGSENIRLITHANVISLIPNDAETLLRCAFVKSLQGPQLTIKARVFVVCCGGIDSARLLLSSKSRSANGIGNHNDLVGRFFQDHFAIDVPIEPVNAETFGRIYNAFRMAGRNYVVKLLLSASAQKKLALLNTACEVTYPLSSLALVPTLKKEIIKGLYYGGIPALSRPIGVAIRNFGAILGDVNRRYIRGIPSDVGTSTPHLSIYSEQEPNPESRVTLSAQTDQVGMPRTILDWRAGTNEFRSIETFATVLSSEWARLGITKPSWNAATLLQKDERRPGEHMDQYHHIGTTRMGSDPSTSVVDEQCRVHGYMNLYIGSSSVFPTSGSSNPTLTIIALCIRIADHIKARIEHFRLVD